MTPVRSAAQRGTAWHSAAQRAGGLGHIGRMTDEQLPRIFVFC